MDSLPWQGFTLDRFFSPVEPKLNPLHDDRLLPGLDWSAPLKSDPS